jgi:N-acetylglucosaminyldiphosphoundecaprenol N-acetyl-beta-D-mannosaminyltransferase
VLKLLLDYRIILLSRTPFGTVVQIMFKPNLKSLELSEIGRQQAFGLSNEESIRIPSSDDLDREVYGVFGIPVDALDRISVLKKLITAAETARPFLLSTANVNFLTTSQRDAGFRESLIRSDLCVADGMPIVWLSKLLAVPVTERVSGADLFEAMKSHGSLSNPLRVFLFGGAAGVGEKLCGILNSRPSGIHCVGWLSPGFGTVEELSSEDSIARINNSKADLLAVFLSAKKAQAWLLHNHGRLSIPVRAQFGATINYQAGLVRRAPRAIQRFGLEWLWRIKEEPYLWRRYLRDGLALSHLLALYVLPVAGALRWRRPDSDKLLLQLSKHCGSVIISLVGDATKNHVKEAIVCFRAVLAEQQNILIDVSQTKTIDARFFGLLLILRKRLKSSGLSLTFTGLSKKVTHLFHLNGFAFLLKSCAE